MPRSSPGGGGGGGGGGWVQLEFTDALLHCFCCDPQLKLFTDFSMAPSGESLIRINHYFLIARQIYQLQFYR